VIDPSDAMALTSEQTPRGGPRPRRPHSNGPVKGRTNIFSKTSHSSPGRAASSPRPSRAGGAQIPVIRLDHPSSGAGSILSGEPNRDGVARPRRPSNTDRRSPARPSQSPTTADDRAIPHDPGLGNILPRPVGDPGRIGEFLVRRAAGRTARDARIPARRPRPAVETGSSRPRRSRTGHPLIVTPRKGRSTMMRTWLRQTIKNGFSGRSKAPGRARRRRSARPRVEPRCLRG
jgi:hypothetical protein